MIYWNHPMVVKMHFSYRLADAELLAMEGITKCITVRCYYLFA